MSDKESIIWQETIKLKPLASFDTVQLRILSQLYSVLAKGKRTSYRSALVGVFTIKYRIDVVKELALPNRNLPRNFG